MQWYYSLGLFQRGQYVACFPSNLEKESSLPYRQTGKLDNEVEFKKEHIVASQCLYHDYFRRVHGLS